MTRQAINSRLSVAPMMAYTDRHFRYLLRLISKRTRLYTEMITSGAILHGDAHRRLRFNQAEHPLAIQLGGGEPAALAAAARQAADYGYDEINFNVGCPSSRAGAGAFGACLMQQPGVVAACVAAMREHCALPVTVKCRTGVNRQDDYAALHGFVETVAGAGCHTFIIHARRAWLCGLNPKQNRSIPPLEYDKVYQLKADFPELAIILNGGVTTLAEAREHLRAVDGVMIGRAVCRNPWLLAAADSDIFGQDGEPAPHRAQVMTQYLRYMQAELEEGESLYALCRRLPGLYRGERGVRALRRHLGRHLGGRQSRKVRRHRDEQAQRHNISRNADIKAMQQVLARLAAA